MQYQTEQSSFYLHTDVHHVILCTVKLGIIQDFLCVYFLFMFSTMHVKELLKFVFSFT